VVNPATRALGQFERGEPDRFRGLGGLARRRLAGGTVRVPIGSPSAEMSPTHPHSFVLYHRRSTIARKSFHTD
jgi:hypothetical protein